MSSVLSDNLSIRSVIKNMDSSSDITNVIRRFRNIYMR
jgi:hypothetical protein